MTSTMSVGNGTGSAATAATPSAGQQILTALGGGSGIDVSSLAQNLVNAEKAPQQKLIQTRIDSCNAEISGFGSLLSAVTTLQTAFDVFKDPASLDSAYVQGLNTSAFSLTSGAGTAVTGSHSIQVNQIAAAQINLSNAYSSATSQVNGGSAFDVGVTVGSGAGAKTKTLHFAAGSTISDVVSQLNKAGAGVQAQIVNSGSGPTPFQIELTAQQTGTANSFAITVKDSQSGNSADLDFSNVWQKSADAQLVVDGVGLTRSSNNITDAIGGLTLNLYGTTTAQGATDPSAVTFQVGRDTSTISGNLSNLVTSYNTFVKAAAALAAPGDANASAGSLYNDPTLRMVVNQIQKLVTGNDSRFAGLTSALRSAGIAIQRDGTLAVDNQGALKNTLNDSSAFAVFASQLTGDSGIPAAEGLFSTLTSKDPAANGAYVSPIVTQTKDAQAQLTGYNDDMSNLQDRMSALLDRYMRQFAAMDSIVGQIMSQKTGLTSTFNAMMATYTNKP